MLDDVNPNHRPSQEISQHELGRFTAKARRAVGLGGEVSVRITSARELHELNRRFRHKNAPTDVLSFPSLAGPGGDIAIAQGIAASNARTLGHSLNTELKILILHGLLHLAGYDHESDNGEMTKRESELRKELGLPFGLIERTEFSDRPVKQAPRDDKDEGVVPAQLKLRPFKRGGSRA